MLNVSGPSRGRHSSRLPSLLLAAQVTAACALLVLTSEALQAQAPACPVDANPEAEAGWEEYRAGRIEDAAQAFERGLTACPGHVSSSVGLGYAHMRLGHDADALALFKSVLELDADNVDALVGQGIVAWRQGELGTVRSTFLRVRELDPTRPEAESYLSRIPDGIGPPPSRPPLILPDSLRLKFRVSGTALQKRDDVRGWETVFLAGVNLGAALPGRHPSQFPDAATYAGWIASIGEMGANSIRVYTIHPPHFYAELLRYNEAHPESPIYLVHGVWTELPEDHNFAGEAFQSGFYQEMVRVVDLLHGRADIPPRPGHAAGFYTADVSQWVFAYIIGREWEPFSVVAYEDLAPGPHDFDGQYLKVAEGSHAIEAWMGQAMDHLVAYETETYRDQRPVAYTNWPTLDPMYHPTETTAMEEIAIRRARGEEVSSTSGEYDNDGVDLDPARMSATASFPAGIFASFHAYPYYPDFMLRDAEYGQARSSMGASHYFGYLQALKQAIPDMPIVIAEYGVPTSLGIAHLQPQGWHHGGHTETAMADIDRRLTLEIAEAGMAGGMVFAWIDEWFKKNWIALEFEIPLERNRLWQNRLDAEQHYGIWAMEAEPALEHETLQGRLAEWDAIAPTLTLAGGGSLRMAADAAHLWLLVDGGEGELPDETVVGFDLIERERGDRRLPGAVGPVLPVGIEFALIHRAGSVQLVADPAQNPFRIAQRGRTTAEEPLLPSVDTPPPGLFTSRAGQVFNEPYVTIDNDDGRFEPLRVLPNRRRFFRDGTEILGVGYDRGILREGGPPDGNWTAGPRHLEVRIPWMLLNFTDPSERRLLQGWGNPTRGATQTPFGTTVVDEIRVVVGEQRDGAWALAAGNEVGRFEWDGWNEPAWRTRKRPVFDALRDAFRIVTQSPSAGTAHGAGAGLKQTVSRAVLGALVGEDVALDGGAEIPQQVPDSADIAWNAGDTETAARLYAVRLEANPQDERALHRLGLLRAWSEHYDEGIELLDRLLEIRPGDAEVSVDRARILAWRGDLTEAIEELGLVVDGNPTYLPALEARAQFQSWAGQFDASLEAYDALVATQPENVGARRAQAQVLSWASRFDQSIAAYHALLEADPGDRDARLGLARVYSFEGSFDSATVIYDDMLSADPDDGDGLRGLARIQSWSGKLQEGEATWRRALVLDPDNLETRVGLTQNLRGQGRNAEAHVILLEAERTAPANPEVVEQRRWIDAAIGSKIGSSVIYESDSDGNDMLTARVFASWRTSPRVEFRLDTYVRNLDQGAVERESGGASLLGRFEVGPGWMLSAGAGQTYNDGPGRDEITSGRLGVATPTGMPFSLSLDASREALDATAALADRGVRIDQLAAGFAISPGAGWRVNGGASVADFEGQEENQRVAGFLSGSRRFGAWTPALTVRAFGFDDDLNEGYFDPDLYAILEASTRWTGETGRWGMTAEVAPGVQQVGEGGDKAGVFRASGALSFRVRPGREVSLSGGFSSTGLQSFSTGNSDYRYGAVVLSTTWVF